MLSFYGGGLLLLLEIDIIIDIALSSFSSLSSFFSYTLLLSSSFSWKSTGCTRTKTTMVFPDTHRHHQTYTKYSIIPLIVLSINPE